MTALRSLLERRLTVVAVGRAFARLRPRLDEVYGLVRAVHRHRILVAVAHIAALVFGLDFFEPLQIAMKWYAGGRGREAVRKCAECGKGLRRRYLVKVAKEIRLHFFFFVCFVLFEVTQKTFSVEPG